MTSRDRELLIPVADAHKDPDSKATSSSSASVSHHSGREINLRGLDGIQGLFMWARVVSLIELLCMVMNRLARLSITKPVCSHQSAGVHERRVQNQVKAAQKRRGLASMWIPLNLEDIEEGVEVSGSGFDDEKSLLMSQMSLEKRFDQSNVFVASTLMESEYIWRHHRHEIRANQCSSTVVKHVKAPIHLVWSLVRSFDEPQKYKPFISRCVVQGDLEIGSVREVNVKSGLPATTSTERLELLDDNEHILGIKIVGGDHRLKDRTEPIDRC